MCQRCPGNLGKTVLLLVQELLWDKVFQCTVILSSPLRTCSQVYVPSGLVALVACLSFWVDPNAVPARVTLGLVCVVTIATQVYNCVW